MTDEMPDDQVPDDQVPDPDPVVRTAELSQFVKAVVDAQSRVIADLIGKERARADSRMEELDRNVIEYVQDQIVAVADSFNEMAAALNAMEARLGVMEMRADGGGGGDAVDMEEERERWRMFVLVEAVRLGIKPGEMLRAKKAIGAGDVDGGDGGDA